MSRRKNPFRFEEKIEDLPRISTAKLKEAGVFEGSATFIFEIGIITAKFVFDPRFNIMTVEYPASRGSTQDIFIVHAVDLKYGRRFFLSAIGDTRRVAHLYAGPGGLRTRWQLGVPYGSRGDREVRRGAKQTRIIDQLMGLDGRGPPRGDRKTQLIEQLLNVTPANRIPQDVQKLIDAHQSRRRGRRNVIAPPFDSAPVGRGDHRTSAAYVRQRRIKYVSPSMVFSVLDYAVETESSSFEEKAEVLDAPIAFVEDHGRLDIREITRLAGVSRTWSEAIQFADGSFAFVHADLRPQEAPHLWVQLRELSDEGDILGEAIGPVQQIRVIRSAHQRLRWFLQCPAFSRNCDVLYLRGGRFASREAQRLVHRSQRAPQI